jgi:hypothetical protein
LTAAAKGVQAGTVLAGLRHWLMAQERDPPAWLDEPFIVRVQERMRQLLGHWRATRRGQLSDRARRHDQSNTRGRSPR